MVGEKNLKTITRIVPYFFGDVLVIGLAKEWLTKFTHLPQFEVHIDNNGKLVLISVESVKETQK